ncbi:hypothetical protein [Pilimelia anulata]|nr:hypothetical protein [Pilimelia anulata]
MSGADLLASGWCQQHHHRLATHCPPSCIRSARTLALIIEVVTSE